MNVGITRALKPLILMGAALVLAMAAAVFSPSPALAAEAQYQGRCGETANWVLDTDGVLTITGTGAVVKTGYNNSYKAPGNFAVWGSGTGSNYLYMEHYATSIVIGEGITSVEDSLFKNYQKVESLTLPSTLSAINDETFANCRMLKSIKYTGTPAFSSIGNRAFYDCRALVAVSIPASVTSVGNQAFENCMALEKVSTASGSKLTAIGESAFASCTALKDVSLAASKSLSTIGENAFDASLFTSKVTKTTVKKKRKLAVSWSKTLGATKYVLYYKPASGGKYSKATLTSTSKTLAKLKKGKKYKVYVVAYMAGTQLAKSKVVTTAKIKK